MKPLLIGCRVAIGLLLGSVCHSRRIGPSQQPAVTQTNSITIRSGESRRVVMLSRFRDRVVATVVTRLQD